jgi:hypothetical protein
MYLQILKNFLTVEECDELNKFTFNAIKNGLFSEGLNSKTINPKDTQLVSRFNKEIVFPDLPKQIMIRLQNQFNLKNDDVCKTFHKDGIIVNVSYKNAGVIEHKDDIYKENTFGLRCNIVTSVPDIGGILHVDKAPINLKKGDLYLLNASEHFHYVSKNESNTPRILWQFTFDAPNELKEVIFK